MENQALLPQKKKERELTENQKELLRITITDHGGDAVAAAKALGYSDPYRAVKTVKHELIEMAEDIMAKNSVKAAMKVGEVMDSDIPIPGANEKLRAAQTILDRTNPKQEKVELSGEVTTGLIILPPKAG